AALLNACLDRVTEVTDELKRLMAEFEKELAVLKGRVDGLEAKVGELEANQFSTTTKLKGIATMVLGGASETGVGEEVTFNYDVRLNLDTSFTGKDLLRTTLRAGNFADSAFSSGNTALEVAFQEDPTAAGGVDTVGINRLFYQFPVGDALTFTVGAKVRQDDMLAMWPSAYPADTVLDLFTYAGARGAYSLNLGAGIGAWYQKDGFSLSVNFVSNEASSEDSTIGVGEDYTLTGQIGYSANNWGAAFVYTYTDFANAGSTYANSIGLSAYWTPSESSWIPSISAGFGYGDASVAGIDLDGNLSWMVGLQWADAFMKGNTLGMALGSAGAAFAGPSGVVGSGGIWFDGGEETLAYELWYKFQVTDNISVTPAFFWVQNEGVDDTYGGLIKTTFKF
ncbi:MAG: iron uptake porin, partial [Cyanobium sp.]